MRKTTTCKVCGRVDAPMAYDKRVKGIRIGFHWSPPPCGLPCEGGFISDEERSCHFKFHSEKCGCKKETA